MSATLTKDDGMIFNSNQNYQTNQDDQFPNRGQYA